MAIAGLALVLQAALIPLLPVNWDEFRFLADVHELARGELTAPVQTFHAHLFLWLTWLPLDEVGQVIAGRVAMLLLECGTAALIYRCAREFGDMRSAAFAIACYLTFSVVVRHGASFRFDPPGTFLLMGAATVLLTARIRISTAIIVGAAVALAAMITIKSVFYVPTLAAVAWSRWQTAENRPQCFRVIVQGALAGAVTLAMLYLYHWSSMAPDADAAQGIVAGSVDKTIGQSRFLPRADALLASLLESPIGWMAVMLGLGLSAAAVVRVPSDQRPKALALLSFALPLVTLAFYRNAFPYYFTFMLAPVSVITVAALPVIARYVQPALVATIMLALAVANAAVQPFGLIRDQRAGIDAVHSIFPEQTPYIDRCSMIASFPKKGIFMSTWGVEAYRDAGRPIFRDILEQDRPAFVIANSPALQTALAPDGVDERLLPADAAVLRSNFIHHWGPIWVAGKTLEPSRDMLRFQILVAGKYTIEAGRGFRLDGADRRPGEVVTLEAGEHVASGLSDTVRLRWGDHLPVPRTPAPTSPLFGNL